jgi:S-DNA-T family DNA segregation ATPase FtsK/SpoIIIE
VVDRLALWRADPPRLDTHPWHLPVAVAEDDLSPAALVLHDADHALVAGPARSGRTSALCTIAAAAAHTGAPVHVVAVAGRRSALLDQPGLHRRLAIHEVDAGLVRALAEHAGPVLVLVDDADRDGEDGPIADLVGLGRPGLHVVAAGRAEPLRQTFGHWTRSVRASRTGLLLQPDLDLDGDLLGCHLPRRVPVPIGRGRGWLANDGDARLVQVAIAPPEHALT